jgi:hypothetical protein
MQELNNKTQATVDQLTAKVSELAVNPSSEPKPDEPKPANEEGSHILTPITNNKRSLEDSPPASPSRMDHARKIINASITPIKRLFTKTTDTELAPSQPGEEGSQHKPD